MDCTNFENCFASLEERGTKEKNCKKNSCLKSFDQRKSIAVSENSKRYELINERKDQVAVFRMDHGLLETNVRAKCDYFILDIDLKHAIFVELKGKNLSHAFEQIEETRKYLISGLKEYALHGRIVTSNRTNVPNVKANPKYVALKKKMDIKIQSNELKEMVDEL
ncbi:MAG: hypothetical protein IJ733_18050 [Lachnospiraceae bacterium]|nr:hypothetical protein [Lachnospiraceae bacterium]